ncbi:hypothetical protein [Rhizobium nepotum]
MNQLLLTNANVVDIETGSVASDRFIAIEDGIDQRHRRWTAFRHACPND